MKFSLLATCMVAFLSIANSGLAKESDPCLGSGVVPNSWLVTLATGSMAKPDLIEVMELLSTGGFADEMMLFVNGNGTIFVEFTPEYYTEEARAAVVKEDVLGRLLIINGVFLECNYEVRPID